MAVNGNEICYRNKYPNDLFMDARSVFVVGMSNKKFKEISLGCPRWNLSNNRSGSPREAEFRGFREIAESVTV